MARPLRLEGEGATYHVVVRGNERRAIFREDADRNEYLRRLAGYRERFGFRVLAYCLMDNHVHLAIQRGPERLSRLMLALQSSYTQWFNRKYRRAGHLFQGRYKSWLVEEDLYLLALIRYIHLNPVRARLVERARDYRWSSERHYRRGSGPDWLDLGVVLAQFGRRRAEAVRGYRRFIGQPSGPDYEGVVARGGVVKGEREFADAVFRSAGELAPKRRELSVARVVSAAAAAMGVDVASLLAPGRYRESSRARAIAAYAGRDVAGVPVARLARHFGRDESTLVRQVLALEREVREDQKVRREVERVADAVRRQ